MITLFFLWEFLLVCLKAKRQACEKIKLTTFKTTKTTTTNWNEAGRNGERPGRYIKIKGKRNRGTGEVELNGMEWS